MASRLVVEILSDASKFSKGLNTAESQLSGFGKQADRTNATFGKLNSRFQATGSALKSMQVDLKSVAAVVASVKLFGLAKQASDAASALEESTNAVNVTFGNASKKLIDFGKTAAREVGLSARQVNELATPIGAVLQNFGIEAGEAADKTIELTQRAADMASVFNVDVSDALGAIQAALRGEGDPIERFGVSVGAAAVEAKALALGLAASKKEITEQDKVAARLALIFEQTAKVAGDFKNTSDGLANSQRVLKAEVENLAADLGRVLLPVAEDVVGIVREAVDWFSNLSDETQENIIKWGLLAGAAIPVITVLGKMIDAYKNLRLAILGATAAQAGLTGTAIAGGAAGAAAAAGSVAAVRASARFTGATTGTIAGLRASTGGLAGAASVGAAFAAWDLGAKAGDHLADALGLAAREAGEFRDGLILPGGIKKTLNDWFGWFEGSRLEGQRLDKESWSEQRALTWATNQAGIETTKAAQSAFLLSEAQSEGAVFASEAADASSRQATQAFLAAEHLGSVTSKSTGLPDIMARLSSAASAAVTSLDLIGNFGAFYEAANLEQATFAALEEYLRDYVIIEGVDPKTGEPTFTVELEEPRGGYMDADDFLKALVDAQSRGFTSDQSVFIDQAIFGDIDELRSLLGGSTPRTTSGTNTPPGVYQRAHGGPVSAGSMYMVGERGPELFVPPSSGFIASNAQSFGSNVTINVNNPTSRNLDVDIARSALIAGLMTQVGG